MRGQIRLSVALVTRNRPENLRRCLASLRAQNTKPWEIVVSDDGNDERSTETRGVAAEFGARFITGPRRGLYANRNAVALACQGTHVRTMDDDHTFPSDHFERCLDAIHSDSEAVWTTGEIAYVDGKYYATAETASQLTPAGVGGPVSDPENSWAIADGSTIYPKHIFDRGMRMMEEFGYGSAYLEFGAYLYHRGLRSRSIHGALIEHHARCETLERGGRWEHTASQLWASLCYNLHFRPSWPRAGRYVLAYVLRSRQIRMVTGIPRLVRLASTRWKKQYAA